MDEGAGRGDGGGAAAVRSPAVPAPPLPRVAARPAPPERSERVREIVAAGRALLAAEGPDTLTMRRVGEVVGIRAASLYKHLPGKPALEAALVEDALFAIGDQLHAVVDAASAADVVTSLVAEYRRFAFANASLYRLATSGRVDRSLFVPGLDDWSGEPFYRATGDPWVAQALFGATHGLVVLEMDDAFSNSSDLGATWRAMAAAFTR
ncbi:TetR/AcrR family transcriptional regulator [Frankia sp. CNm7]|uniref:TetR/AcrR family transcriptional regulator n=1 Tax=Frankia nepalensis TaxID=1836974 RepID=A0A937RJU3_9ACTN|nr:TetR/AcrR family transcriptional regulator [Frankia nepalensis]MBL7513134.1 TetR/AcrR family transcriptional regulator [Frankia nepalensis]MBL7522811.1 TetR/AcrR family transcriptional regulator [Frankia nepalensis]MBL7633591.1 TetR/AcrR family transcriptional regulator [Frankia nepalensis]